MNEFDIAKERKRQRDLLVEMKDLENKYWGLREGAVEIGISNGFNRKAYPIDSPVWIDNGFLIARIIPREVGVEVVLFNDEFDLKTIIHAYSGEVSAQQAINTIIPWFDCTQEVVPTGEAIIIEERNDLGLYKIPFQIQDWNLRHKLEGV